MLTESEMLEVRDLRVILANLCDGQDGRVIDGKDPILKPLVRRFSWLKKRFYDEE